MNGNWFAMVGFRMPHSLTDSSICSANSVNVVSVGKNKVTFFRRLSSTSFFWALRMNSRPSNFSDVSMSDLRLSSSHGIRMLAEREFWRRPYPRQHWCVTEMVFFLPPSLTLSRRKERIEISKLWFSVNAGYKTQWYLHCGANAFIGLLNARIQTDVNAIVNVLCLTQWLLTDAGSHLVARIRWRIPIAQLLFAFGANVGPEKNKQKNPVI